MTDQSPSAQPDILEPYRSLVAAGFPQWQIALQVRNHISGLEALPADTEGREAGVAALHEYLQSLDEKHGD